MIKEKNYKRYEGQALQTYNEQFDIDPYFPSEGLIRAVEVARLLERPLLLRGAPGSGKTRLAEALAFELHGEQYQKNLFKWNIKSTTKANEGLYTYDHLQKLRDTQDDSISSKQIKEKIYWTLGPLGEAFQKANEDAPPPVLIIDEIDKADIDFPNDLLDVLDGKKKSFEIKEASDKRVIEAIKSPIIIITSNDERELPNAFLRRCVFYYLPFPDDKDLIRIAEANIAKFSNDDNLIKLITPLVSYFTKKHKEMETNPNVDKPVSTSELLDWLRVIAFYKPYDNGELTVVEKEESTQGKNKELVFTNKKVLYPEVLFKSYDDWKTQLGVDYK